MRTGEKESIGFKGTKLDVSILVSIVILNEKRVEQQFRERRR